MAPFCVHSEHDSDALLVCLSIYGPLTRVAGGVSVSAKRIKRFGPLATEWAFFFFGGKRVPPGGRISRGKTPPPKKRAHAKGERAKNPSSKQKRGGKSF